MTGWQRERNIEKIIYERIGKKYHSCYVYLEGRNHKRESVDIAYYWGDSAGRYEFSRSYPASTAKLSVEEIAEMFLMDWVFGQ